MPKLNIQAFRARTMIMGTFGHYLAKTGHDHETASLKYLPLIFGGCKRRLQSAGASTEAVRVLGAARQAAIRVVSGPVIYEHDVVSWIAPDVARIDEPFTGPERGILDGFLDWHRSTLLWKCAGLTGEQLALASVPTRPSRYQARRVVAAFNVVVY